MISSPGKKLLFLSIGLMLSFLFIVRESRGDLPEIQGEEVKSCEKSEPGSVVLAESKQMEKPEASPPPAVSLPQSAVDSGTGSCFPTENCLPETGIRLFLPTGNREIYSDPSQFFMYTNRYIKGVNTKPWQGGNYGFVRNPLSTQVGEVFTRLHEGIDIRPLSRDSRDVPLDDVRSMADGTVVYLNDSASRSNYGKYVVVKHDWAEGAFYSLYAHLASTAVTAEQEVKAGDILGRLGYTGDGIDRERAHVHVELNFLLSDRYAKDYSCGDAHQNYNGINLCGIDLARFLRDLHDNPNLTMKDFLAGEVPYCKVRAPAKKKPGILGRYPWLGCGMENEATAQSWEFTFARTGVPLSIRPVEDSLKYPLVTWVKKVNTNHSYMTMGRLQGSGSKASLSSRGLRYITLISEAF